MTDAAAHWEARYADSERIWSGRPNAVLVDVTGSLAPGRALDLGSGEGGDALWLVEQGWHVTAVDIAPTAIRRAAEIAHRDPARFPPDRMRWVVRDLAAWAADPADDDLGTGFDLVTASFLQSWFEFPRAAILRRAASLVAPGGHLLVVAHAAAPAWADPADVHDHVFPTPEDDLGDLDLSESEWDVVLAETRSREATAPDGRTGLLDDGVVLVRRR